MKNKEEKDIIVAYHEDCIDGLASAWALEKKFKNATDVRLTFIPYGHHNQPAVEEKILSALTPQSEIIFADVAPRAEFLKKLLSSEATSIRIIDHHKSALANLNGMKAPNLRIDIDPDHPSAALMVWETFHPHEKIPEFLQMIARMDVHTDLHTQQDFAVAAYIDSKDIHNIKEAFQSFEDLSKMTLSDMTLEGSGLYRDQYNRIKKLDDNIMFTQLTNIDGLQNKQIPVINADVQNFGRSISQYLRETGQKAGADVAFAWYVQGNGKITMSIRSNGTPDASHVAKGLCDNFGIDGGGHGTSAAVHFKSLTEFLACIPLKSAVKPETKAVPPAPHQK